jgi:hypothetical protein
MNEGPDMVSRRWLIVCTAFLLASAEPDGARWLTDYREALEAARVANKPIFVVFRCEH